MAWRPLETRWRSHVVGQPLSQPTLPVDIVTSARPYEYAAQCEPLAAATSPQAVKVRLRVQEGTVGLCLMKPNGSALLSAEAYLGPDDGETEALFRLPPGYGPSVLMVRKVSEDDLPCRLRILDVGIAQEEDLSEAERAVLRGPSDDYFEMPELNPANVARADEPMWPISIGNTCEAKVQISRVLQFRRKPDTSQAAFRLMMLPPRGEDRFGWDLFDWQGTPIAALVEYIRRDFQGLYEREDLQPGPIGVMHRSLGVEHLHDYEHLRRKGDPAYTEAMVDEAYPAARERFDRLAAAFRERLTTPGPYLYVHVCEDIPSELNARRLIQALASKSPEHRFHVLFVGFEDEDSDLSALRDQVSKAYRPRPPENIEGSNWEGDYAAWDKALAPFALMLPAETPADLAPPQAAPAPEPAATPAASPPEPPPRRPGFFARLLGR